MRTGYLCLVTFFLMKLFVAGCGDGEMNQKATRTPSSEEESDSNSNANSGSGLDSNSNSDSTSESNAEGGGDYEYIVEECSDSSNDLESECEITRAAGAGIAIKGTLLLPSKVIKGGIIVTDSNGNMTCVGCGCSIPPDMPVADCGSAVVSPGLINTHDHIGWTHQAPAQWDNERYDHRHDWRKGKRGHSKISVSGGASKDQKTWGELRQLMSGTTTLAGAGDAVGLVRNVDSNKQEGLDQEQVELDTFPLGDASGTLISSGCSYGSLPNSNVLNEDAWIPHVGEGIDAEARNEFLCLSSDDSGGRNVTGSNGAFVHAIAINATDSAALAAAGTSVIWSPRSNIALYGNTAPVTLLDNMGVKIALGTDWTPSGSMNMVRELRCADYLNSVHFGSFFTSQQLWRMATDYAAEVLAIDDAVGALEEGLVADLVIYHNTEEDYYRNILNASPDDTLLVFRGGEVLYGNDALVSALTGDSGDCETMPQAVCGSLKRVCLRNDIGKSYSALVGANSSSYELYSCEVPSGEPTCVPKRPGEYSGISETNDVDGDGIANSDDNCENLFNPVRPIDGERQADMDEDGVGDVCDPCPLDANSEDCRAPGEVFSQVQLDTFSSLSVFVEAGNTSGSTREPLFVELDRLVETEPVVVSLMSSDTQILTVEPEITIPAGSKRAEVLVSPVMDSSYGVVTISASLGEVTLNTTVNVLDPNRVPTVSSISPNPIVLHLGSSNQALISLNEPAPVSGTKFSLASTNDYFTTPSEVEFTYWEQEKLVTLTSGELEGDDSLTIQYESTISTTVPVTVTQAPPVGLVLSEVFPNAEGADDGLEWVEIFNGTGAQVNLENFVLGYTDGGNIPAGYTAFFYTLSGVIEDGACVVIGGPTSSITNGNPSFFLSRDFDPDIQNSGIDSKAHGIALFEQTDTTIGPTTLPSDLVLYGSNNEREYLDLDGQIATHPHVEAPRGGQSIVRTSEGWVQNETPTPGVCVVLAQ